MTIKLIRAALVLLALIGCILTAQAAEFGAGLAETMGSLAVMFVGMISLGLSFCISIRKGAKQ